MDPIMTLAERARLGGLATASRYSGKALTLKARATFIASFLDKVDPSGELRRTDPQEAQRRADKARELYFAQLAYKSVKARRLKARTGKKNAAKGGQNPDGAKEVEGVAATNNLTE